MDAKNILILLEKLQSKTINLDELKRLKRLLDAHSSSTELLELMHQTFKELSQSNDHKDAYEHENLVRSRLEQHIPSVTPEPTKKSYRIYYWMGLSAAASLIFAFLFYIRPSEVALSDLDWEMVSTKHGERKQIILSDGTKINLNGNTILAYPKHVQNNLRLVKLEGEAFFDIAKNENKPFLVISKDFTTQVLGTSFNIDSDISKVVEVNTGQVQVFSIQDLDIYSLTVNNKNKSQEFLYSITAKSNEVVSLVKGQKAQLGQNNRWVISDYTYKTWLDNEWIHLNEPLIQVVQKAYRNFGDSITIDQQLANKNITITFRQRNKEQVLSTLAELSDGELTLNHKTKIWEIKKVKK